MNRRMDTTNGWMPAFQEMQDAFPWEDALSMSGLERKEYRRNGHDLLYFEMAGRMSASSN